MLVRWPIGLPSSAKVVMAPPVGVMVKLWPAPCARLTAPLGVMVPPADAVAVTVKFGALAAKVAAIVWFA